MITQYGVLAYDIEAGEPRFLLITSRRTRRWVIPRGNPMRGLTPAQAAAQEAYEEAGVTGIVTPEEIGTYIYRKVRGAGVAIPAEVHVFPLRATVQSSDWPERRQREWRWFTRKEAVAAVEEPSLKDLIRSFEPPGVDEDRLPGAFLSRPPPPPSKWGAINLFRKCFSKSDRTTFTSRA